MTSLIQHSVESQPQNPEFRNNPENFHPCYPTICFCPENVICLCFLLHEFKCTSDYCKFGNFQENFICGNSVKTPICYVKKSRLAPDLPISVNARVFSPFHEGFIFTKNPHENFRIYSTFILRGCLKYFCFA